MCVLGRPFGLRNLAKAGKNVVLMRDLTDTMYNSRQPPQVNHFTGTDLIVEHIEKYVCPTHRVHRLHRQAAVSIQGGQAAARRLPLRRERVQGGRDAARLRPRAGAQARPATARSSRRARTSKGEDDPLHQRHGDPDRRRSRRGLCPATGLPGRPDEVPARVPGPGRAADRPAHGQSRLRLAGQRPEGGHDEWPKFDPEVLGGNYHSHYGAGPVATITLGRRRRRIIRFSRASSCPCSAMARSTRPARWPPARTLLLVGTIPDQQPEPVAWTHRYKNSRVFYTSLGHPDDFAEPAIPQAADQCGLLGDGRRTEDDRTYRTNRTHGTRAPAWTMRSYWSHKSYSSYRCFLLHEFYFGPVNPAATMLV